MQASVERILKQYRPLCSYFLSQDPKLSDNRLNRLQKCFSNPMTEIYLLFFQSVLSIFTNVNLLLQRDNPCIHFLYDALYDLLKKILNRFISRSIVDSAQSLLDIDFQDHSCQVPNTELMVGFTTKQALHGVQGDVEPRVVHTFFSGVFAFYTGASHYLVNKFNWNDEVLINARFVDFHKRKSCSFTSVEYFLNRFSQHLPILQADSMFDEFRLYQGLSAMPSEILLHNDSEDQARADIIWHGLENMKDASGKAGLIAMLMRNMFSA